MNIYSLTISHKVSEKHPNRRYSVGWVGVCV